MYILHTVINLQVSLFKCHELVCRVENWISDIMLSKCVSVPSGGVIREDSAYSIAVVPTSAARCPRCRRYTVQSADCLCPRCKTVVSQAHWHVTMTTGKQPGCVLLRTEERPGVVIFFFFPLVTELRAKKLVHKILIYVHVHENKLQLGTERGQPNWTLRASAFTTYTLGLNSSWELWWLYHQVCLLYTHIYIYVGGNWRYDLVGQSTRNPVQWSLSFFFVLFANLSQFTTISVTVWQL